MFSCGSCWVNFPLESNFPVMSGFVNWGFGVSLDFAGFVPEDWELLPELDWAGFHIGAGVSFKYTVILSIQNQGHISDRWYNTYVEA